MQADAGFVEDEEGVGLVAVEFRGEFEALGLPARERRGRLAEGQVAESEVDEGLQPGADPGDVADPVPGLRDRQREDLGEGEAVGGIALRRWSADRAGFRCVPGAVAVGADDVDVGEELDVE